MTFIWNLIRTNQFKEMSNKILWSRNHLWTIIWWEFYHSQSITVDYSEFGWGKGFSWLDKYIYILIFLEPRTLLFLVYQMNGKVKWKISAQIQATTMYEKKRHRDNYFLLTCR